MRLFVRAESGQITNTPLSLDTTKHSRYITLHHAVHGKRKTQAQIHNGEFIYSVRRIIGKAAEALKVIPKSALIYRHEKSNEVFTLRQ